MSKFRTPKSCWVRRVELQAGGAEIGFDCHGPSGGGRGTFPLPRGQEGYGNYPSAFVRGVRSVEVEGSGATTSGVGAKIGFVLMPRSASCRTDGSVLRCKVS